METLVDCGSFRYHLLVQYNDTEDGCAENVLLEKLYDALDAEDDSAVTEARNACMELVRPFMFDDYAKRVTSDQKSAGTIKLQAVTKHGVLCAAEHDLHLEYPPTKPVKNEYPGIHTVTSADVETLEEIDHGILKVNVGTETYCLKSVHRKLSVTCFEREIKILQRCSHPNVIRLFYLMTDQDNMVEAMLLEYIPNGRLLSNVESVDGKQYTRWTTQIREALTYLHFNNLIWGDAKPGNVLIRENDSLVLIDFGGGYTKGWVDHVNSETVQGDWQGYERIVQFLQAKMETS